MKRSCFVARDLCSRGYAAFESDVFNGWSVCRPVVVCGAYVRGRTRLDVVQALKILSIGVTSRERLESNSVLVNPMLMRGFGDDIQ